HRQFSLLPDQLFCHGTRVEHNSLSTFPTLVFGDSGPFWRPPAEGMFLQEKEKQVLLVLVLLLQVVLPAGKPNDANVDSRLLESGQGTTLRKPAPQAREIKVVSYNIRWRTGDELKQIANLLRDDPKIGGASIIALQEVDRHKERTGNSDNAKTLADELGMYY